MDNMDCCSIEAIVTCDERGQVVLPKEIRQKMSIEAGDKLTVMLLGGKNPCCLMLMKAQKLENAVTNIIKVIVKESECKNE
jgi:AbrB family looped-hinge helix DNA binding protein